MKKLLFIVFIYSFFIMESFAQLEQSGRIEIPMDYEDENFEVLSAEERGIILYREVKNRETKMERKYQVILIDTAVNKKWESHYFIDLRYIIIGFEHFENHFYLLFQRNTESLKADLFVLRIDLDTKISETFLIEREYAMELTEFEVLGNTLIFGGYANTLPTVIIYQFGKKTPKVVPGLFNERTQIQHLELDDKLRIFNVLVSFRIKDGRRSLSLNSFDEHGDLIKNINLQPSNEYSLLFGRTVKLDRNVELIVGTYSRKRSDLSRGIFLARISPEGDQIINYYNYADLKNFFNYMKASRQRRVEQRIQRRKIKGKKNKFDYRLLVHEVVEQDGKFIMVGEAFYPKYNQSSYYSGYGSTYFTDNFGNAFEGYKYTHAVVFGFDRRGRLIWDNSFEINDVISYSLEQFVHITPSEKDIALLYMYENEIRTKIIEGNDVLEGKNFNELKLAFEDDIADESEGEYGGLEKWYNGNLFAYGVLKIKNMKDEGVKLSREVFFINKIRYQ